MEFEEQFSDVELGRSCRRTRHIPKWRLARRAKKPPQSLTNPSHRLALTDLLTKLKKGTFLARYSSKIHAVLYVEYVQSEFSHHSRRFEGLLPPNDNNKSSWLLRVVGQLYDYVTSVESPSLTGAVTWLLDKGTIHVPTTESDTDQQRLCVELVFTLVGIMTMLYAPHPDKSIERKLLIDSNAPNSQHIFEQYAADSMDLQEADRPLAAMLNNFGDLWPRGHDQTEAVPVQSAQFNGAVFTSIGRIRLEWTDLLPAHLDFDLTSRTLYIYQKPTFCLLNIPSSSNTPDKIRRTILDSCFDRTNNYGYSVAANYTADYMKEVLLSIHLIFGQSAKSRKLFRQSKLSKTHTNPSTDPLLTILCTQSWPFADWSHQPKECYLFRDHFPILGSKLQRINNDLRDKQPSNIWLLWRDQRNPMQWWTF